MQRYTAKWHHQALGYEFEGWYYIVAGEIDAIEFADGTLVTTRVGGRGISPQETPLLTELARAVLADILSSRDYQDRLGRAAQEVAAYEADKRMHPLRGDGRPWLS